MLAYTTGPTSAPVSTRVWGRLLPTVTGSAYGSHNLYTASKQPLITKGFQSSPVSTRVWGLEVPGVTDIQRGAAVLFGEAFFSSHPAPDVVLFGEATLVSTEEVCMFGVAIIGTATATFSRGPHSEMLGEATIVSNGLLDTSGVATLFGEATLAVREGSAQLLGEALLTADLIEHHGGNAALLGQGFVNATGSIVIPSANAVLSASAFVVADSTVTIAATLSGLSKVEKLTVFRVVNQAEVVIGFGCQLKVDVIENSYENGLTVQMSEEVVGIDNATLVMGEQLVIRRLDNGDLICRVWVSDIQKDVGNPDVITYTAEGAWLRANRTEVVYDGVAGVLQTKLPGYPISWVPRNQVFGVGYVRPTIAQALEGFSTDALNPSGTLGLLDANRTRVADLEVPTDFDSLLSDKPCWADLTVSGGFSSGLQQIFDKFDPGAKVFFDNCNDRWGIAHPLEADIVVLDASGDCDLSAISVSETLTERYTAVQLIAQDFSGKGTQLYLSGQLTPAWPDGLEQSWSLDKTAVDYGLIGSEHYLSSLRLQYWGVYRVWEFPSLPTDIEVTRAWVRYQHVSGPFANQWYEVEADVVMPGQDFRLDGTLSNNDTRFPLIVVNEPLVLKGNPYDPGDTVGATNDVIGYVEYSVQEYVVAGVRKPLTGYAGTAFTSAGLKVERIVELPLATVPDGFNTYWMNQQILESLADDVLRIGKDVGVEATVSFEGGMLLDFFNLNKQLTLTASGVSGINSLPVVEFRHEFTQTGRTTLRLSNDVSRFLKIDRV